MDAVGPAEAMREFLVGEPIGPVSNRFDPTGAGSSFLRLDAVVEALNQFQSPVPERLSSYVRLLEHCGAESMGVYIRIDQCS